MIRVSDRFKTAISGSHHIATRAELWSEGSLMLTVPVISGSVTIDSSQQFRRQTTDLVIPATDDLLDLVPANQSSLLAPNGNEVKLFRGVAYDDGTEELCPVGMLAISQNQVDDSGQGVSMTITAYDRSRKVSRASLTEPLLFSSGASAAEVIATVIHKQCRSWLPERWMNLSTEGQLGAANLPPLYYKIGDDPWQAMSKLATACGGELYFDASGLLTLRPIPDPKKARQVWSYNEGPGGQMTASQPLWDDQYVVNTWIVTGSGSVVTKVVAVAKDEDLSSPTSVPNFGEAAQTISTGLVKSQDQAQAMANGLLKLTTGIVWSMTLTASPNPALETVDVIEVNRSASKVQGKHVIQSITMPLDPGSSMSIQTRQVAL
jgi:hypothetical protein